MKVRQRHIAGRESLIESSVQRMKFSAKIPHLHKAQARYGQVEITRILLLKKNYKPFKLIINA